MQPLVSIIIPTYNHEKYIKKCIFSVLKQSFANWEIIVVDDASTDNTGSILADIKSVNEKITLIQHKKNWGINNLDKIYNQALDKAKGKLIAILEGDDFWPKDKLQNQLLAFNNPKTVLSFADCVMTDANGQGISLITYNFLKKNLINQSSAILSLMSSLKFYLMSPTVMIKKSGLLKIGGFKKDKNYPFIDIPTYMHLALIGNFSYTRKILGYYRKSPSSAWFKSSKTTKNMGRESVKTCLNNFLILKNIKIDKKILSEQEKYLNYKSKQKNISEILHYLFFADNKNLKRAGKKILKTSNHYQTKFIALILLFMPSCARYLIYTGFFLKFLLYKSKELIFCCFMPSVSTEQSHYKPENK